ncbi:hypothetical protein [Mycolicibacterium fortuitum]|uniref:hypothetical protein n=1 Tax=Mycolicibacterium fortuitum TaxID=1766 RepID=UPI001AEFBB84|nr:hypothetical protein [Mycolicibacterium fortuitum]MBP3087016.1 hypothetical protein [Mycolicibacterium fortuitum]
MTDPKIRLLFTRAQLIGMGRCPDCGWHPKTQGHHPECPTWDESTEPAPATRTQHRHE